MTALIGWTDNRADSPIELEITDELAEEFLAHPYYRMYGTLYHSLTLWLASKEGRSVAWDPTLRHNREALEELYFRVRAIEDLEVRARPTDLERASVEANRKAERERTAKP